MWKNISLSLSLNVPRCDLILQLQCCVAWLFGFVPWSNYIGSCGYKSRFARREFDQNGNVERRTVRIWSMQRAQFSEYGTCAFLCSIKVVLPFVCFLVVFVMLVNLPVVWSPTSSSKKIQYTARRLSTFQNTAAMQQVFKNILTTARNAQKALVLSCREGRSIPPPPSLPLLFAETTHLQAQEHTPTHAHTQTRYTLKPYICMNELVVWTGWGSTLREIGITIHKSSCPQKVVIERK